MWLCALRYQQLSKRVETRWVEKGEGEGVYGVLVEWKKASNSFAPTSANFRVVLDKNFAAATPRQKKREMEKNQKQ